MGPEAKRRLKLRNLPNEELLRLYDSELVLRIHNVKNLSDTRKILNRFRTTLGQYPPSAELAKSFIAQYANRQPRTLYRYAQMIKAFMKWYGEPISDLKVKIPKSIPRYTEDEEIEKVRKAIEDKQSHKGCIARDLLLYDLARTSGLRRAELANLEAKDIHADFLEVRKGKGGKDRTVPLTPTLAVRLQNFIVENNLKSNDKIFFLTPASISNKIRLFAKKAGVSTLHTHTLRHKFATNLVEKGNDLRVVQELMGHDNLNTTKFYIAVTDKRKHAAIRSLKEQPETDIESDNDNSSLERSDKENHGYRHDNYSETSHRLKIREAARNFASGINLPSYLDKELWNRLPVAFHPGEYFQQRSRIPAIPTLKSPGSRN